MNDEEKHVRDMLQSIDNEAKSLEKELNIPAGMEYDTLAIMRGQLIPMVAEHLVIFIHQRGKVTPGLINYWCKYGRETIEKALKFMIDEGTVEQCGVEDDRGRMTVYVGQPLYKLTEAGEKIADTLY